MIPQLVTVRWRRPAGRWRRLYVPVLLVLLLLAPLLVLAVLGGLVACRIHRVDPVGALRGAGRLVVALPGVRFGFEGGGTAVQVNVR